MDAIPSIGAAGRPSAPTSTRGGVEGNFAKLLLESEGEVSGPSNASSLGRTLEGALDGLEQGRRRMDALIAEARSGKCYQPAELLAVQAEVYRISECAALTQKVVEAGVDGMRRLWSMQL